MPCNESEAPIAKQAFEQACVGNLAGAVALMVDNIDGGIEGKCGHCLTENRNQATPENVMGQCIGNDVWIRFALLSPLTGPWVGAGIGARHIYITYVVMAYAVMIFIVMGACWDWRSCSRCRKSECRPYPASRACFGVQLCGLGM